MSCKCITSEFIQACFCDNFNCLARIQDNHTTTGLGIVWWKTGDTQHVFNVSNFDIVYMHYLMYTWTNEDKEVGDFFASFIALIVFDNCDIK